MNHILANAARAIPYVGIVNTITGNTTATLLLLQLEYWFARYPEGFYKFIDRPKKKTPGYRDGDSWCEELFITRRTFERSFEKIGVRYNSTKYWSDYGNFQGMGYVSVVNRRTGHNHFYRNHELMDVLAGKIMAAAWIDTETKLWQEADSFERMLEILENREKSIHQKVDGRGSIHQKVDGHPPKGESRSTNSGNLLYTDSTTDSTTETVGFQPPVDSQKSSTGTGINLGEEVSTVLNGEVVPGEASTVLENWKPAEIDRTLQALYRYRLNVKPVNELVPGVSGNKQVYRTVLTLSKAVCEAQGATKTVPGDQTSMILEKMAQEPLFALWYEVHEKLRAKGGRSFKSQVRFGRTEFSMDALEAMARIKEFDVNVDAFVDFYLDKVESLKKWKNISTQFTWKRFMKVMEGFIADLETGKIENGADTDPPELQERLKGLDGFARERARVAYLEEKREQEIRERLKNQNRQTG